MTMLFSFHRFLNCLKRMVKNKAHVEGSIVNAYLVREASFFCSHYFEKHVYTRARNVPRQDDGGAPIYGNSDTLPVFNHPARLQGKPKKRFLTPREGNAIQTYFLLNVLEIDPFISIFDNELRQSNPRISEVEVASQLQKNFITWFYEYAENQHALDKIFQDIAHGPLVEVITYPIFFINGYRFHTETHGSSRSTYNCGVCVDAGGLEYFGNIQEIMEVEFHALPIKRCIFFRCDWFDPTSGVGTKKHENYNLVEVNKRKTLCTYEPFILGLQAMQVSYISFPNLRKDKDDWLAVCRVKPRGWIELVDGEVFTQPETETYQDPVVEACMIESVRIGESINLVSTGGVVGNTLANV
ncbi:uncharacterized protein LOC127250747 isoform X4 [Andrographis paniculata]|uniref:uncharacterized protein LOC127250747 isoform X4 n=1 Tax=Andrographis paniculata TaxID=175694 RepID=UPI0021E76971|nr:uncharacterized protein LOC127250747 isoform X4 [Andrographis paniculata]